MNSWNNSGKAQLNTFEFWFFVNSKKIDFFQSSKYQNTPNNGPDGDHCHTTDIPHQLLEEW